ncbi:hypothetical protein MUK42_36111 [Musa troglodytarum]|uniref:Uncharacterized protein n=1 Tax=Musa troglodytarum TaxID=320322 RepID=A0A9E7GGS7_9LILI|nr:hypothetical protein MUK42_36111 [Musa troglodytarum]
MHFLSAGHPSCGKHHIVPLPGEHQLLLLLLQPPAGCVLVEHALYLRGRLLREPRRPEPRSPHPLRPPPLRLHPFHSLQPLLRDHVLDLPPHPGLVPPPPLAPPGEERVHRVVWYP